MFLEGDVSLPTFSASHVPFISPTLPDSDSISCWKRAEDSTSCLQHSLTVVSVVGLILKSHAEVAEHCTQNMALGFVHQHRGSVSVQKFGVALETCTFQLSVLVCKIGLRFWNYTFQCRFPTVFLKLLFAV